MGDTGHDFFLLYNSVASVWPLCLARHLYAVSVIGESLQTSFHDLDASIRNQIQKQIANGNRGRLIEGRLGNRQDSILSGPQQVSEFFVLAPTGFGSQHRDLFARAVIEFPSVESQINGQKTILTASRGCWDVAGYHPWNLWHDHGYRFACRFAQIDCNFQRRVRGSHNGNLGRICKVLVGGVILGMKNLHLVCRCFNIRC
mmetsp:Transcript_1882/g.4388  ORF Transcript_1882/g.4388 Transcript_1882/m.4388 type:complete len:201 (+) Transcript_1882:1099-1701(+)